MHKDRGSRMKKSDLKDGMVVQYRDGTLRIVDGEDLLDPYTNDKRNRLHSYEDDLKNIIHECNDIVTVYEKVWEEITEYQEGYMDGVKDTEERLKNCCNCRWEATTMSREPCRSCNGHDKWEVK